MPFTFFMKRYIPLFLTLAVLGCDAKPQIINRYDGCADNSYCGGITERCSGESESCFMNVYLEAINGTADPKVISGVCLEGEVEEISIQMRRDSRPTRFRFSNGVPSITPSKEYHGHITRDQVESARRLLRNAALKIGQRSNRSYHGKSPSF